MTERKGIKKGKEILVRKEKRKQLKTNSHRKGQRKKKCTGHQQNSKGQSKRKTPG